MSRYTQTDRLSIIVGELRKKEFVSIEDLTKKLSVTERTIRNDVTVLNHEFCKTAEIQLNKGQYAIHVYRDQAYRSIAEALTKDQKTSDSPENRAKSLIAQLLAANEPITMDDLSEQLNVSRSTLVNDLTRMRVTLDPYELVIKGKPNQGIQLQGSEWHKRLYILQNNDHVLDQPLDDKMHELVHQFAVTFSLAETTEREFVRYVSVVLRRSAQNPLVQNSDDFDQSYIMKTKEYGRVNTLADQLEKRCGSLSTAERAFLTIPVLGRRSPVHLPTDTMAPLPESILQLINDIEEQVVKQLNITIDFTNITNELGYHLLFMLNRLIFGVKIYNSLMNEVQEKYPLACEIATIAHDVIKRKYQIDVSEAELSYLAYYFGIAVKESQMHKRQQLERIAIVCDTGRGSARIISMQLKEILPEHVAIQLFSSRTATKELMNTFDLVFSTVSLPDHIKPPIIEVKDIFDERALAQKISKLCVLDHLHITGNQQEESIICRLLNTDRFFLLSDRRPYYENLKRMIHHLEEVNTVDAQFKERLIKREKMRSTVFDHGIAFPHTVNMGNSDIVLAVGVYPEKHQEEHREIRIVFLLGIPENNQNETLLVQLYEEMIALAKNDDWLHDLSKETTCSDFRLLVKRQLLHH
ncbi:BglG family transcription antiterminator [Sporolactobacillus nakayamae]|uniref:Lichenan operon transcriptional antiterminator n=1 Tax=Sporolactobacillus nakayamae TaxID=269670 RepID=A0A1I2S3N2_9BACL|nr:BglG family transcription antiterminator [Sporolactobacillus nakayamae]SFG47370.1 lichenan operon transcriptional antiterminator [Sporolactobacillus nakayamae]